MRTRTRIASAATVAAIGLGLVAPVAHAEPSGTSELGTTMMTTALKTAGTAMTTGAESGTTGGLDSTAKGLNALTDVAKSASSASGSSKKLSGLVDDGSKSSGMVAAVSGVLVGEGVDTSKASNMARGAVTLVSIAASSAKNGQDIAKSGAGCNASATSLAAVSAPAVAAVSSGVAAPAAVPLVMAAVPAGVASYKTCLMFAGQAMVFMADILEAYRDNPNLPQIGEFAEVVDPESPVGKKVNDRLGGGEATTKALTIASNIGYALDKVNFGRVLRQYGNITQAASRFDVTAIGPFLTSTIELGQYFLTATVASFTGKVPKSGGTDTVRASTGLSKTGPLDSASSLTGLFTGSTKDGKNQFSDLTKLTKPDPSISLASDKSESDDGDSGTTEKPSETSKSKSEPTTTKKGSTSTPKKEEKSGDVSIN